MEKFSLLPTILKETISHPNYSISWLFFLLKCILCLKLKPNNNKVNSQAER